jgi:hypothetical protein
MNRRNLEQALRKLRRIHEQGLLPPALEPLLMLSPPRGAGVEIAWRRSEDGQEVDRFDARECGIWIEFVEGGRLDRDVEGDFDGEFVAAAPPPSVEAALADLVRTLDEAERTANLPWIALKFLRDRLMPERADWARATNVCRDVIADAITRGIVRTGKQANPRMPEFPVTSIELERAHEFVVRILGVTTPPLRPSAEPGT